MSRPPPEMIEPDVDGEVSYAQKRAGALVAGVSGSLRVATAILAGLTLVARAIYELEHTIRCIDNRRE